MEIPEKSQGPRGLNEAGRDTAPAARQNAEELTAGIPHPDTGWERVRADGERWMTAAAGARSPDEDMQADEATGDTDMGSLGILEPTPEDFMSDLLLQQLGSSGRSYRREHRSS